MAESTERVRVLEPPPQDLVQVDQLLQLLILQASDFVGATVGACVGALVWKGRQSEACFSDL
jgi:hypothetical protein